MAAFTRELYLQALEEWGHYAEAFGKLGRDEQAEFLKAQGYASMRDLLAHVGVWWEEGRGVIAETIKHGEGVSRKYDFAEFNAASLKRFKDTPEDEFYAWYEAERKRLAAVVQGLTDEQLQIRRVRNWLNGIILQHLKEHGVDAPRFLIIDMLQREWGDYVRGFNERTAEQRTAFLQKQGYARFRDLAAHIIAWWEHGIGVIEASASSAAAEVQDVDAFNARAVERFGKLEEAQVWTQYENTRLTLANLMDMLPDEVLAKPNVRSWLRADVIDHYYEHAL